MKKLLLFVAVVSAFSFASCKKDRTCTCTYSNGTQSFTFVEVFTKAKKSDAKKQCIDQTTVNGGVTETVTCKLN